MASRDALYMYAGSVAHSWESMGLQAQCEFLKDMYEKTVVGKKYDWQHNLGEGTEWDALMSKRWLRKDGRPGGTNVAAEGTSWCGIFATYCLRAIGVPATWKLEVGIDAPAMTLERRPGYFSSDDIGPGDICVVKENQHHFIVHHRSGNMLYSYDGNLDGQTVGERSYNIDTLKQGVKDQAAYDSSFAGRMFPDRSKYSFFYYRLK